MPQTPLSKTFFQAFNSLSSKTGHLGKGLVLTGLPPFRASLAITYTPPFFDYCVAKLISLHRMEIPALYNKEKMNEKYRLIYLLFQSSRLNKSLTAARIAALLLGYMFCLTNSSKPSR